MNDRSRSALSPPELIELDQICDAFAQAWRANEQPTIEEFLSKVADELRDDLLRELIVTELDLRREVGQKASQQEYVDRFPDWHDVVRRAFQMAPRHSSSQGVESTAPLGATSSTGLSEAGRESTPEIPTQIDRYLVDRVLGSGNFGMVYLAYDPELDRRVAIKVPRPERTSTPDDLQRFVEEARHAAKLDHPGIVRIHDVQHAGDSVLIVQQYVEGKCLSDFKDDRSQPKRAASLLVAIAEAVSYAHQHGLVHRDLKPANILIDSGGSPHVVDFGLAVHENSQRRRRGERAGSPAYMSPEQVQGLTHRLDGRSDIWSLGVILYELLVGRRPFAGENLEDLYEEILEREPRPPRQIDPSIPAELERICLKCLAKRMTDRYTTAADLAHDLRHWESVTRYPLVVPAHQPEATASCEQQPAKVIPKGLRSFDSEDADFFLQLLPGPRDRDGLPDSIRFWKTRVEHRDPDRTFSVGVIYGPSGCGKSSLVKAGLLPRLDSRVIPIYVEATAADTEVRLLKGLRKRLASIPSDATLREVFDALRDGRTIPPGQKVLLVLDQFEQWLHAKRGENEPQLLQALRHCDGQNLQCVVMVRDDFWLAVSRFLADVEVDIVQGHNLALVDLFDLLHARNVLTEFGRAYGRLPELPQRPNADQELFLDQAVDDLAEDGKVICVRLALFAEMVKGRPWTPATFQTVGGTEGVGITFLEETFSASTAAPKHWRHQAAARSVLKALLPEAGTDIKGHMQSRRNLLEASGYAERPRNFDELIRVLDGELRLITPTDLEPLDCGGLTPLSPSRHITPTDPESAEQQSDEPEQKRRQAAAVQSYQLTHDYLVPSLRQWLTRKQKETWRGRAELRLEERTAQWTRVNESRFLPNPLEYLSIVAGVPRGKRTADQRRLMRAAGRRYGAIAAMMLLAGIATGWFGWQTNGRLRAEEKVNALRNASIDQVPDLVSQLAPYRRWAGPDLLLLRADDSNPDAQLYAALALLPSDQKQVNYLLERLLSCSILELPVIRDMLGDYAKELHDWIQGQLRDLVLDDAANRARRFNAALVLATYGPEDAAWTDTTARFVVDRLLSSSVDLQSQYRAALQGARRHLVAATAAAAADPARDATHRLLATNALVDFAGDQPQTLARALVVSTERQYSVLLEAVRKHPTEAIAELQRQLVARPERGRANDVDVSKFSVPGRDLVAKIDSAVGLVHPHFAFCQSLPLADFAAVSECLRSSGYRPTRIRPYTVARSTAEEAQASREASAALAPGATAPADSVPDTTPGANASQLASSLYCAVVWQRDGRDWQFRAGLTAETLFDADREMEQQGLEPADVAPYVEGNELLYTVLWVARPVVGRQSSPPQGRELPSEERPVLEVGLTLQEFQEKLGGDRAPMVLQIAREPNDSTSRAAVIWHNKGSAAGVALTLGDSSNLVADAAKYADRIALDIALFSTEAGKPKRDWAAEHIERIDQQLAQSPNNPALLRARGMAAVHLGQDQQAVEDLTKALKKNPADRRGQHFLAVAHARLGHSEAAARALEEVLKLADHAYSPYSQAIVQAILGKEQEALAGLEETVKENASDAKILYNAVCAYALIAEHLTPSQKTNDSDRPEVTNSGPHDGDRVERMRRYKERAIELLVLACDAGYYDAELARTDPDLESLRSLAGFQRVLDRLGAGQRYAAIWAVTPAATGGPSGGGVVHATDRAPHSDTSPRTDAVLLESAQSHGLDVQAHLNRCRELIEAGYGIQSLAVRPGEHPSSLVAASTWLGPAVTLLDDSARRNALAAIAMLQLGEQDQAWRILQHSGDPRGRTYWLHDVRPMGLDPETLAARLETSNDDKERFGLLQALGEYDPARVADSVRGRVLELATGLYRSSPRRDLHAAARWLLVHWGATRTVAEIDKRRMTSRTPAEGSEWFTNGQGMTMVVIPAGEFLMGSPASEPERFDIEVHRHVTITRRFALCDMKVNLELFDKFYREAFGRPYDLNIEQYSPWRGNGPVVRLTWFEALAFCRWLSDREGMDTQQNCLPPLDELVAKAANVGYGHPVSLELPKDFVKRPGYRLPTEAEWEYACRAGVVTRYNFGNDPSLLGRYAWFMENSGQRAWPGGLLKPNDWGLFDMHGNAFEWCMDWSGDLGAGRVTDPYGPALASNRLVRGSGWDDPARLCRAARRHSSGPTLLNLGIGFRVVLVW
jgi:hypothetical protein